MVSSMNFRSACGPIDTTHQEGDGIFNAPPFLEPVFSAFSTETFLLPLSESCLNPTTALTGTYDGMCGDGETLPRFALRVRQDLPAVHPVIARHRDAKESRCRNT